MRARSHTWLWGLWLVSMVWPARAEPATQSVPIVFHVATNAIGEPVASPDFLASAVAAANEIFAPVSVRFEYTEGDRLAERHANLVSRADRDALLPYVSRGAVPCMVVAQLMDVDEPGRVRRGVHWYRRGSARPHLIILSAVAGPRVLAHELGHYLGLPAHSEQPGNVMSYTWTDAVPHFDPRQIARLRATIAQMRRAREL